MWKQNGTWTYSPGTATAGRSDGRSAGAAVFGVASGTSVCKAGMVRRGRPARLPAMILAGDIGGTNTRLAVFDDAGPSGGRLRPVVERSYLNAGRGGLESLLAAFAAEVGGAGDADRIDAACFGVAGPVEARGVALTNLPWTIDADSVAGHLRVPPARVTLVNDMVAHGASTADLSPAEIDAIQTGRPDPAGTRAILMPGTGLGVGGMAYDAAAGHVRPFPSEGGHVDFAPATTRKKPCGGQCGDFTRGRARATAACRGRTC